MFASSLLLAWALVAAHAPSPDACRQSCEASESGTDRQTCLLQCEQQEPGRETGGVVRTHTTERKGGAPPGSVHEHEGGSTTTVETTLPDGTRRTRTTRDDGRGTTVTRDDAAPSDAPGSPSTTRAGDPPAARNQQAAGPWIVVARCQARCDPDTSPLRRATCKLRCLDASPGVVRRVRPRPAK